VSIDRASVALAYIDTRRAQKKLRSRANIERRQARLWRDLEPALAKTPALAGLAGRPHDGFPVIEPCDMRARLEDWNSLGLNADAIHAAAEAAERGESGEVRHGVSAGFSTGSEGVRGVFLSTPKERAFYLGQSLAKLLPSDILRRRRIGLCLRANNALYRDVSKSGPFTFRYFPLGAPHEQRALQIEEFAPDIFIAPSFVLAELARLAEVRAFLPPKFERVFYGAEPMGAAERDWITRILGVRPDPIYQATEGFLGAACADGTLHLNEDSILFEFERIGHSTRHRAIITDLKRTSQPMVRVRLDDLIEFNEAPCPCGSPLRAVHPIEGRATDVWRWGDAAIFPREIEKTITEAIGPSAEWRASGSPSGVRLATTPHNAAAARDALASLLAEKSVAQTIALEPFLPIAAPKRRRVRWLND
jgi:putative adenylate-forming enzyme